jgi:hypothetical protein
MDKSVWIPRKSITCFAVCSMWYLGYSYITNIVDSSSHLIKQSIFNVERSTKGQLFAGDELTQSSRVSGNMLQRKGVAEIEFSVRNSREEQFHIFVKAHRNFLDWKTDSLIIQKDCAKGTKNVDSIVII